MCEHDVSKVISQELGCSPLLVHANRVLPANRHRLYWCDFDVLPDASKGEKIVKTDGFDQLLIAKEQVRFQPDPGWTLHKSFVCTFPTLVG